MLVNIEIIKILKLEYKCDLCGKKAVTDVAAFCHGDEENALRKAKNGYYSKIL